MKTLYTNERKIAGLFFIMSAAPLLFALISQYGFGLHPCHLCIFQRIPFGIIMFVSFIAFLFPRVKISVAATVISIHAFLINSGIGFYHTGVERQWWQSTGCASTLKTDTIEALRASLMAAPSVRCDEVQFEFLTLSMASWNCIYCALAGFFAIYVLVKYFKNKRVPVTDEQLTDEQ